jgi:hypothetical protein
VEATPESSRYKTNKQRPGEVATDIPRAVEERRLLHHWLSNSRRTGRLTGRLSRSTPACCPTSSMAVAASKKTKNNNTCCRQCTTAPRPLRRDRRCARNGSATPRRCRARAGTIRTWTFRKQICPNPSLTHPFDFLVHTHWPPMSRKLLDDHSVQPSAGTDSGRSSSAMENGLLL